MKFHWKVLLWMLAGVLVGVGMQFGLEGRATIGAGLTPVEGGLQIESLGGPSAKSKGLAKGDVIRAVILDRGGEREQELAPRSVEEFAQAIDQVGNGAVVWVRTGAKEPISINLELDPGSKRAQWIAPFQFLADIFMALLKMLIVPIILTSIINGVASVGEMKDLRRMGLKTFAYYVSTSLLAVLLGQILVNMIQPGKGARLGLPAVEADSFASDHSFWGVLKRMIPENIFQSFGQNGQMLQVIFFALLFGYFITQTASPHRERMRDFFVSAFEVMLRMAQGVLSLLPYGVFCLMVRVVAKTGLAAFEPLFLYMLTVTSALLLHSCVTLPIVLRVFGRLSPVRWFKAMSPALMTAFSTSSSSMTLPVTMETVEHRGRVSNKVTSFTLPLGATINMDGTALYECIGVIFLAQYYESLGAFELTLGVQAVVVLMALLASIGAAGIPSAGLVMMLTILSTLGLPIEGAALLLAVDRPLDMLRTVVNIWSDSCGAAVIARSEGEEGPALAGAPAGG